MILAFGKVEGARLDGQLQISRKTTGYGTASSELRNVLAKAKKRTEGPRRKQGQQDNEYSSKYSTVYSSTNEPLTNFVSFQEENVDLIIGKISTPFQLHTTMKHETQQTL